MFTLIWCNYNMLRNFFSLKIIKVKKRRGRHLWQQTLHQLAPSLWKNSRIRETKHLSTDADSSTNAIGGWTKAKSAKKTLAILYFIVDVCMGKHHIWGISRIEWNVCWNAIFLVRARWSEEAQMRRYQPILGSSQLKKIDIPNQLSDFHINY